MSTTTATLAHPQLRTVAAVPAAIASAVIVGDVASTAISAIAHQAGVSHGFAPLHFATYTSLIVLGVIGGAIGWQVVRSRAGRPDRLLRRLVPLVLVLSFVPDILMGISKGQADTTWGGVVALMAMHVVVALAAVTSYRVFLPVTRAGQPSPARRAEDAPDPSAGQGAT